MSTIRLLGFVLFSACLYGQYSVVPPNIMERQPGDPMALSVRSSPLLTASGDMSVGEEFQRDLVKAPDPFDLVRPPAPTPITGVVSLKELQHPISKKALREAYDAQQAVREHDLFKAIAKLEKAIRIEPEYRDAHLNLGVQYARVGRLGDARAHFLKALDIGPPAAPIYVDLALTALATESFREAENFARQALGLEPANNGAQKILEFAQQR